MFKTKREIACTILFIFGLGIAVTHAPVLAAGMLRYTSAVTPLLDAAGGKPIGSLGPGAALEVRGQSGGATQVAVHGWSAQGANAVVFVAPDRHIVTLSGLTGHTAEGNTLTSGGTVYHAVTIEGFVTNKALVDDVQTVWKSARDLYAPSCASCHPLPKPNSYSANQWPGIMKTQAANAGLDPDQTTLLTTYLQVQSGR
ncbi:MAG: hypothetical protein ABSA13_16150 [Beijerinckiaceae bacterium]|jgi:hypothetical protein